MIKESQIIYETNKHWVLDLGAKGYEVYRKTITHSERCARIGFTGTNGLNRAKAEIERRELTQ
jgi:hypothetical protein